MESHYGMGCEYLHCCDTILLHILYTNFQDLYDRDCQRMPGGLARSVPRLKETHVLRDSLTKLNIALAGNIIVLTDCDQAAILL